MKLSEKPGISIEELIQGIVDLIPPAWQFPHLTCVRIIFNNNEYKTKNFRETKWKISSSTQINDKLTVIDICYFEDRLFLEEEKTLLTDITSHLKIILEKKEPKRMEVELQRSEQQYRTTLNSLNEAIHVIDRDRRIVLINPAFEQWIKNLNIETDLIGREIFEVLYFLPESIREEYRQVFETGETLITMENVKVKGREYFTEVKKIPILFEEKVTQVITIIHDITERKIAEQKLKESEENYCLITENLNDFICMVNEKYQCEYINEDFTFNKLGYKNEDLIGETVYKFIHPEDIKHVAEAFQKGKMIGEGTIELRFKHKNGQWIWLRSKGKQFIDKKGDLKVIIISRDITDLKIAERNLKESEEKYRHLFENSPYSILLLNTKGTILDCNSTTEKMFGYEKDYFIGKNFLKLSAIPSEFFPLLKKREEQFFKRNISKTIEFQVNKKDENKIWVQSHSSLVKFDKNNLIQIII